MDLACVPLPDSGCLVSYVDITDTVRIQHALEERNLALEMADQVKTEFIANASYELRTPHNTIVGCTDDLDDGLFGELNPRQKKYVGGIINASWQQTELIGDILDLATIETGYMAPDLQRVSVAEILENGRDNALEKIESGQLKIKVEVDDSMGIVIKNDASGLYDTFEHGDPYVSRTGSGLGHALTQGLVELHGGDLEIRNDIERGTHAMALFPVEEPSSTAAKTRASV